MTEQYKGALETIGVDVTRTIERFMGKQSLYEKFLLKFLDDENYQGILDALDRKDLEEAFRHAHTLKGVGGNLGFENLMTCLKPMVEDFRKGRDTDPGNVQRLTQEYNRICQVIRANS